MVCAIQCALVPILLGILPVIPQWAHFGHGWVWISIIFVIAIFSLGRGYQAHKNKKVVLLALTGLIFLLSGTLLEEKVTILTESFIFFIGGILLSISHWKNYKLLKNCS